MAGAGTVTSVETGTPDGAAVDPGAAFPPATEVVSTSMPGKGPVEALDAASSSSSSPSMMGETVDVPYVAL